MARYAAALLTTMAIAIASPVSPTNALPLEATLIDATVHLSGDRLKPTSTALRLEGRTLALSAVATQATFVSPIQSAPFPFTGALPSWNGHSPAGSGFRTALRTQDASESTWSPWLEVGWWGSRLPERTDLATTSPAAWVDIDTLHLKNPAKAYQWRVDLRRDDLASASPTLRRLSICLSGDSGTPAARAWRAAHSEPLEVSSASVVIPAPFHGQITSQSALTGRICSPCTVTSALGAFGVELPTETVAAALYDPENDMYGVWPRATQGAAEFGVESYVTRIRSWGELRRHFEAGHVVGASIRFKAGALAHPPYPATAGHLILLRGFNDHGDVITCDSYRAADGDGKLWPREDLAIAWFNSGGVAYVFEGAPAPGPRARPRSPGI